MEMNTCKIGQGNKSRVQFKILQVGKEKGGMFLPWLKDYCRATQLQYSFCWCNSGYGAKMERLRIKPVECRSTICGR